jgi:hypothetical protein
MALKNHPPCIMEGFFFFNRNKKLGKKHEHEGKLYVQAIVDNFNEKFHDLVFNASELSSSKY